MQRALAVLVNEYAVTDSRSDNPRALTLGVQSCVGVGVGFMLGNAFNTAAAGHFFCHAQTLGDAPAALKAYVDDGVERMLADIGWKKGMKLRAAVVGGIEGWGDEHQSDLLVEFVHAALARIDGVDIVYDHSYPDRQEDILIDSAAGLIRPLAKGELDQTTLDNEDTPKWAYSGPDHLKRLDSITDGNENPAGSRLARHPQSITPAPESR